VGKAKVKAGKRPKYGTYNASKAHLKKLMPLQEKIHKDDTNYVYWIKWSSTRRFSRYFEEAWAVFLAQRR
jgi:hypothetical protein